MKPWNFVLFSLLGGGFFFLGIYFTGAPLILYWDIPSLIMLLFLQACASLAYAGPKGFLKAFSEPFAHTPAPADLRKARSFWTGQTALSFLAAFLGLLQGAIAMANRPASPELMAKGSALAFLMVLYALILNILVIYPYRLLCERRLAE